MVYMAVEVFVEAMHVFYSAWWSLFASHLAAHAERVSPTAFVVVRSSSRAFERPRVHSQLDTPLSRHHHQPLILPLPISFSLPCFNNALAPATPQRQRKRLKRARGGAKRRLGQGQDQGRRKDNDPLQTFEASELGADGSYGPGGGGPRDGRDGGGEEEEEDPKEAAKRMNEERESRVMQVRKRGTEERRIENEEGRFSY